MAEPRVALVHDWLTGMRGGEKVLLEFCRIFPKAKVYTLLWNSGTVHPEIERRVARTSFLQRLPRASSAYRLYLPLFPRAIRSLSIKDADLVISSSHAVAKGVDIPSGVPHVSYVHTPMRYLWDETNSYFRFGPGRRWKRAGLKLISPYLRRFDLASSETVDHFIANSETVRGRINRLYQRDATVIHPPVDTDFFRPASEPAKGNYYLVVSSLEPYKRIELAIDAFRRLGRPLWVAGSGSLRASLQRTAGENVRFLGHVPGRELRKLYQNCRALIFPGMEDFGIVPVEAQACGKPVVCYGKGGATESVIDGETGVHFLSQEPGAQEPEAQEPEALIQAVENLERGPWDSRLIRENSLRFSVSHFHDRMEAFLKSRLSLNLPLRHNAENRRAVSR